MIACVFSGQGAQYAGMGRDLCAGSQAACRVYDEAADFLGFDLLQLDEERLAKTRFTQLSVVVLSLAAWQALLDRLDLPADLAFAGFSAGEYSVLGASGILELPDLLGLVNERARLMQEAAEASPGAMFAILGLDDASLLKVVRQPPFAGKVFAANFNCPGQVVISGLAAQAEVCANELKAAGARRISRLKVNGAFHTPLMKEASLMLAAYARKLSFHPAAAPVYSNIDGSSLASPDWPEYLARHMCCPVLWSQEVLCLQQDGCASWVEFGPGKVLCGLIRKILPGSAPLAVEDRATLSEVEQSLRQL
jgi:[acyl-carrier-protein] S-malonyltransferase